MDEALRKLPSSPTLAWNRTFQKALKSSEKGAFMEFCARPTQAMNQSKKMKSTRASRSRASGSGLRI